MSTDRAEMEAVLEAILFVVSEPVSRARLMELFDEGERDEAGAALDAVLSRYAEHPTRGVMAEEVAGGLRIVTRADLHGWLRRFFEISGRQRLSMAALETLAIVAYRQPITSPEIQELRGVNPAGVLKTLLERRLVRIKGRKEVVGKPFLYATTREFLMHFGLRTLSDLPPLEEFEEILGEQGPSAGEAKAARPALAAVPEPDSTAGSDSNGGEEGESEEAAEPRGGGGEDPSD